MKIMYSPVKKRKKCRGRDLNPRLPVRQGLTDDDLLLPNPSLFIDVSQGIIFRQVQMTTFGFHAGLKSTCSNRMVE
jgi:hypothetical protein